MVYDISKGGPKLQQQASPKMAPIYQTWCHIQGDCNLHTYYHENLRSYTIEYFSARNI
jgi:hypothetical protein